MEGSGEEEPTAIEVIVFCWRPPLLEKEEPWVKLVRPIDPLKEVATLLALIKTMPTS